MAMKKEVLFSVGKGIYGLDVDDVMGIEKKVNIVSVPNAPQDIHGIMNLRGEILPVYSLYSKFHLDVKEQNTQEYIIGKCHGVPLALEVDQVKEIVEIDDEQIENMPVVVRNEDTQYAEQVATINNEIVLILNLDGLLDEVQKGQLHKFMESVNKD